MGQVSRPMLIALAATIALAAVWLVALRPKPVAIESAPLAPTEAIPAAKQASAASDAANAKLQAADPSSTEKAAAATRAARPATADPATRPAPDPVSPSEQGRAESRRERAVLREIRQGNVVVMLFWSAAGADDVASRDALRSLNRRNGKVKVHIVPIGRVGEYGSITRGVTIAQSPTTLIIDRDAKARTIVGLSERQELGQAVGDALARR